MSELPIGWVRIPMSQACTIVRGVTYNKTESSDEPLLGYFPILRANNIQAGNLLFSDLVYVPERCVAPDQLIKAGDVVVAMSSGSKSVVGKAAKAESDWEGSFGAFCGVLRPSNEINPRYFYFFTQSAEYRTRVSELSAGVNINNLKPSHFELIEVAIAPRAEQTRIAAKLDELLAQVDTLKARIDGIPALLKRFRQSVLAAAVSGRLTEEWRARNVGWVDEWSPTTAQASSLLPVSWSSKTAGNICGFITKGTTPSKEKMTAGHGEVPYIKVYNLTFSGALDFSIDPTFVDINTHSTELKRSIVKPGDVLMNIVGPPLGKVSIVPTTYPEWNINQAIARFSAADGISPEYLALCLRTEEVLNHAVSRAKATAGQFNLTLEICRELPLPVPPEEEQTEIVRRVEQLFAFADRLEARVTAAQSRLNHLTQSILAKAFRGELVPQDPNDEPASVLLERIKAQRAAAPKAKRGRRAATLS
ncbi:restriction endonuclease subunit S [Pseudomonas knackmussii]|uniref:Restriction endonuclease subunit S n=1 Tax=Pseudomonas knackmussii TaxID=65741 RepID=A0ABY4KPD7_9PSED|nr:restriction endonuclease subunit S [Pseudomonas knackmussii]UPQ82677.1 restriction endonuclease subunit S [Pseudomonas knackmussii]